MTGVLIRRGLWEAKVGRLLESRSLRPAWATWRNPVSTKYANISWAWWCEPVVPATWEAEVGGELEPGRQRKKRKKKKKRNYLKRKKRKEITLIDVLLL